MHSETQAQVQYSFVNNLQTIIGSPFKAINRKLVLDDTDTSECNIADSKYKTNTMFNCLCKSNQLNEAEGIG